MEDAIARQEAVETKITKIVKLQNDVYRLRQARERLCIKFYRDDREYQKHVQNIVNARKAVEEWENRDYISRERDTRRALNYSKRVKGGRFMTKTARKKQELERHKQYKEKSAQHQNELAAWRERNKKKSLKLEREKQEINSLISYCTK